MSDDQLCWWVYSFTIKSCLTLYAESKGSRVCMQLGLHNGPDAVAVL